MKRAQCLLVFIFVYDSVSLMMCECKYDDRLAMFVCIDILPFPTIHGCVCVCVCMFLK